MPIQTKAQNFQESFGQNRIQFHPFDWSYYETDHFKIYFYPGGQEIGKYVIYAAEKNLREINEQLGIKYRSKIALIVFSDISDANQTNLGSDDMLANAALGNIKIIENKLFIYYTGVHSDLDRQIRRGIMHSLLEKSGLGVSYDNILKTFNVTDVPAWYAEGMKAFVAQEWNTEFDNQLKEKMIRGAYKDAKSIHKENQVLLGHSILHYIHVRYGLEAIKNLFYYCRRTKNLETALFYVLNKHQDELLIEWYDFYRENFNIDTKSFAVGSPEQVPLKLRKKFEYYNFKLSPNKRYLAFVTNIMGKYRVNLYDRYTKHQRVVFRGGFKTQKLLIDHNYPLIEFGPNSENLIVIDEKKDQVRLTNYALKEDKYEIKNLEKFQRIYSFAFAGDRKTIVLSAAQKGITDIFLMNINTQTTTRITNDFYDDLYPQYFVTDSSEYIVFSSNREKDSVQNEQFQQKPGSQYFDLYAYDLRKESDQLLGRISSMPFANENGFYAVNKNQYLFRSDVSGIANVYVGKMKLQFKNNVICYNYLDSNKSPGTLYLDESVDFTLIAQKNKYALKKSTVLPVYQWTGENVMKTNFNLSIDELSCADDTMLVVQHRKDLPLLFLKNIDSVLNSVTKTAVTQYRQHLENKNHILVKEMEVAEDTVKKVIPIPEKFFQTEFDYLYDTTIHFDETKKMEEFNKVKAYMFNADQAEEGDSAALYRFSKTKPYKTRFYVDNTNLQFNNNFLIDRYQRYPSNNVIPPFGPTFTLGIKDLFENYRIYGGMRINLAPFLSGNEFFITYENKKQRLDKRYTFYRRANTYDFTPRGRDIVYTVKEINNYVDAGFSYPFDYTKSLRFNIGFKMNSAVLKSTNIESLLTRINPENWFILRTEYVFDNTIVKQLNIPNGTRFKTFLEFYKEVPTDSLTIGGAVLPIPQFNEGYFLNIGFDLRTYTPLVKNLIWANRFTAAASMGTRKILYQLGGIDNELFPSYNQETQIAPQMDYSFQMFVYNLRGFPQNTRNGNNVALVNSELRVPIFSLLSAKPIKNSMTRDFMFVLFTDVGMAWSGINPYSRENPNYIKVIRNDISEINAYYLRNPMVASFGVGTRIPLFTNSPFLGYYLKIDLGWKFDSGKLASSPGVNFSLTGIDF